jgi:hypothetical protein
MDEDTQRYVNDSVYLLKNLKTMLANHNKSLLLLAGSGDVLSASIILHNNVAQSAITTVLSHKVTEKATPPEEDTLDEKVFKKDTQVVN